MVYTEYFAISPLDGRYKHKIKDLSTYFSEFAYMKYRLKVEIEYFIQLTKILPQLINFPENLIIVLRDIYLNFSIIEAVTIKNFEREVNHDVKAVEYFLREKFDFLNLALSYKEFIHFGLTSQDINNTAFPLMLKDAIDEIYTPTLIKVKEKLLELSIEWKDYPMISRTHGQPATPTKLGKEVKVFIERINNQMMYLRIIKHSGKFGGAVGNFNAHKICFPEINWEDFGNKFLKDMGLYRQKYTTQIENYDEMSAFFNCFERINTILIDLCRDFWQYISMDYMISIPYSNEVGSSTMPHKINPINFENAEGNFCLANSTFSFLSSKLPISRLQRDLTDSTVSRSIGVPLSHTILGFRSLLEGLNKIRANPEAMKLDLEKNWVVVTEAIQTILRREGFADPYKMLKNFTRGKPISKNNIKDFVSSLDISLSLKKEILSITPFNYTGL